MFADFFFFLKSANISIENINLNHWEERKPWPEGKLSERNDI